VKWLVCSDFFEDGIGLLEVHVTDGSEEDFLHVLVRAKVAICVLCVYLFLNNIFWKG